MKSKIIVSLAIVIGLVILIILFLPVLLDLNRYRDRYLPALEQALHRSVEVQDVRLTLFPKLGIRLRDITIAEDPAISPTPFFTIPSAEVEIRWWPLLHRQIQVEHVRIQDPTVRVIRTQDGALNTATIGKDPSLQPKGEGALSMGGSLEPLLGVFAVERFSMTGGSVKYEDRSQEHSRSYLLENLAFVTNSVQFGQTASIQIKGMIMPYRQSLEIDGQFGPLQPNLDVPRINVAGKVGQVAGTAQGKLMAGRLELDVQIPNVSTSDIPLDLGLAKPVVLNHIQAHLMAPLFANEQSARPSGVRINPLTLDIQLGAATIHLTGKGSPGHLNLVGESSSMSSQDFPLALRVHHPFLLKEIRFETAIQGARVDLMSLHAKAFRGNLEAQGKWDGTYPEARLSLQGKFKQFAVEPVVQTIRSSSLRMTGTGELHWSIAGSLALSGHPNLSGPVRLKIRNGQLVGFDLVQAIEEALQLSGLLKESTGATQFSLLDTNAVLGETGLVIRELTLDAPDFSLNAVGNIGFDRSLTLHGNLALPPVIGDRIIQRFPMAKIVRHQGKLLLPFEVNGTMQEPVLQLNTKSFGNQIKKNLERRLEKALKGDEGELQQLLKEGEDLLKQLFGK